MTIRVRFDEADWARIRRDYTAWWAHELDRPLIQVTGKALDPAIEYPELHSFLSNYPPDMSVETVAAQIAPHVEATHYHGDALPRVFINFGPGILAGFLGARVHSVPETVWFEPALSRKASDIALKALPENRWWQRVKDLTRTMVEDWGGRVQISHTDLGGNLDIVASFRTTEGLLLDLYDAPEQVERLAASVTSLWVEYYDDLTAIIRPRCPGTVPWAPIWSPATSYMLQCDFCYMISPAMFERFVEPDLVACCDHLEHGFYHLDGPGALPHLDQLLSIERLRGIQWVPGSGNPPPEEWPAVLRRIIGGGKLCQLFVTAQGALSVVRSVGGRGFMFTVSDEMDADEARAFLERMAEEDIARRS